MKKFYSFLHIIRINNLLIGGTCVLLSSYLLTDFIYKQTIVCFVLVITTMSFGYLMNDIIDIKPDIINHKNRVLVREKISLKKIKQLRNIFFIISVILATQTNTNSQIVYFSIILRQGAFHILQ